MYSKLFVNTRMPFWCAVFALADTILADGVYDARVTYRQTQVITLLFN